jgi:hypothetical protein
MGEHRPTRFLPHVPEKGLRLVIACLLALQVAQGTPIGSTGLDRGFGRLYDLDFSGAQKEFES